jgi:pentatricopeptide repeat protein
VLTDTTLIRAFCKVEDLGTACAILGKMLVKGICPNLHTYTSLIKVFLLEKKAE